MEKKTANDLHYVILQCILWWTSHSEAVCAGLSRTGIVSNLTNLLPIYIRLNCLEKVRMSDCNLHF